MRKERPGSFLLVGAFIVLSISGIIWMWLGGTDNNENQEKRYMATRPEFSLENYGTYSEQFSEYLNDNMPFRNSLLTIDSCVNYFLFGNTTNEDVIVGKNDWLFYARKEDGDPIGCYQGTNLLSEEELRAIADNCIAQKEFLEKDGREFVIFIAPNKERIYYEHMPEQYGYPAENYQALQIVNYLRQHTDIRVVYPYEELMQAKESRKEPIWYKTDTHWNWIGAYVGAAALLKELGIEIPDIGSTQIKISEKKYLDARLRESYRLEGLYLDRDLADMLHLGNALRNVEGEYWVEGYKLHDVEFVEWDLRNMLIFHAEQADARRLYMVRDSFASHMAMYLGSQFDDSCMRYWGTYQLEEMEQWNPDIVVYETVERRAGELRNFTFFEK